MLWLTWLNVFIPFWKWVEGASNLYGLWVFLVWTKAFLEFFQLLSAPTFMNLPWVSAFNSFEIINWVQHWQNCWTYHSLMNLIYHLLGLHVRSSFSYSRAWVACEPQWSPSNPRSLQHSLVCIHDSWYHYQWTTVLVISVAYVGRTWDRWGFFLPKILFRFIFSHSSLGHVAWDIVFSFCIEEYKCRSLSKSFCDVLPLNNFPKYPTFSFKINT